MNQSGQHNDPPVLEANIAHRGTATVVTVTGAVDMLTAPMLLPRVAAELARRRPAHLIIDCTDVHFLSSAGLHALIQTHHAAGEHTIVAVVAGPATSRPIRLSRVDEVIDLYTSLDEALTVLVAPGAPGEGSGPALAEAKTL
jgi:anti-sigma B factor antagonist